MIGRARGQDKGKGSVAGRLPTVRPRGALPRDRRVEVHPGGVSGREFDVMDFEIGGQRPEHGPGFRLRTLGAAGVRTGCCSPSRRRWSSAGSSGSVWGRAPRDEQRQAEASSTLSLTSARWCPQLRRGEPRCRTSPTWPSRSTSRVVNSGPALVSDVAVTWDAVHQAYSTGAEGKGHAERAHSG